MANPSGALHLARMAKRMTQKVTIYTAGAEELAQQVAEAAVSDDIRVDSKSIARLEKGEKSSVIMHFKDGQIITEGFLVGPSTLLTAKIPAGEDQMLILLIGSQAQKRTYRTICSPNRLGAHRSWRYQDQRFIL